MTANVIPISNGPRWRVLIAHQRGSVRHVVRTLIETEHTAILEVADEVPRDGARACALRRSGALGLDLQVQLNGLQSQLLCRRPPLSAQTGGTAIEVNDATVICEMAQSNCVRKCCSSKGRHRHLLSVSRTRLRRLEVRQ
jgi:hypothetical protein